MMQARGHWHWRRVLVGAALSVLVGGFGVASAAQSGVTPIRGVNVAATVRVLDVQDDQPTYVQLARIGKVEVFAEVGAAPSSTPNVVGHIGLKVGARNTGTGWVAIAFPLSEEWGTAWIAPLGEEAWIAGEVLNEQVPGPDIHGTNGLDAIGIIDESGAAASGTIAWSASMDPDGTARVTFTVNLRG